MRKKIIIAASFALIAPIISMAAGPEFGVVKYKNKLMTMTIDSCVTGVKITFVQIRSKMPIDGQPPSECIDKGKEEVKSAYDEIKGMFAARKVTPPAELVEWRVEWNSAFDSAMPMDSDIERVYLQRVGEAKRKVERATSKLEISLE